jgi:hypothetical protein
MSSPFTAFKKFTTECSSEQFADLHLHSHLIVLGLLIAEIHHGLAKEISETATGYEQTITIKETRHAMYV